MSISETLQRGTMDLLLLTLLRDKDMYGYQLSQELSNRSGGLCAIPEGSLYPTLYRMLDQGLISDQRVIVGRRRARIYYHLEPAGEAYLHQLREEYLSMNQGIMKVLASSPDSPV